MTTKLTMAKRVYKHTVHQYWRCFLNCEVLADRSSKRRLSMETAGAEVVELFIETVENTDEYGLGATVVRLRLTKPGDVESDVVAGPNGLIVFDDSDGFCEVVSPLFTLFTSCML